MSTWPCVVRRGFIHRDGPCACFRGGSAPEWPQEDQLTPETQE